MCISCVATEARLPDVVRRPSADVSELPAAGVASWSPGDPGRIAVFERQLSRFGRDLVAVLAAAPDRCTVEAISDQVDWPGGVTVDMALREVTAMSDAGRRTPAVLSVTDAGGRRLVLDRNYACARSRHD